MNWATEIVGLVTLVVLEVVLGIDNIIFMALQVKKLPAAQQSQARIIGLTMAGGMRILFVCFIGWLMKLEHGLFKVVEHEVTGKDLIMIAGGLYLLWHSVKEIHEKVGRIRHAHHQEASKTPPKFMTVIVSVMVLDLVFSIDSVMTAVGLVETVSIMITAIIISVAIMMFFSGAVVRFVDANPSVQILGLAFLVLIGALLVGEGSGYHFPKGAVYFAMAFATTVDFLQMRAEKKAAAEDEEKPAY